MVKSFGVEGVSRTYGLGFRIWGSGMCMVYELNQVRKHTGPSAKDLRKMSALASLGL